MFCMGTAGRSAFAVAEGKKSKPLDKIKGERKI
jgi:hypothetical protein